MTPLLLTAGATRNPVDGIRYLSAHATGATAVALLPLLTAFDVTLLGSAEALLRAPQHPRREEYGSTRDLAARMEAWLRAHPGATLVHSAAVGDYEVPPEARVGKIASGAPEVILRLVPTLKIVDQVHAWCPGLRLVSFKAGHPGLSPDELEAIARAQLRRTRSEIVFANVIGALQTSVMLVRAETTERFADRAQAVRALARALVDGAT